MRSSNPFSQRMSDLQRQAQEWMKERRQQEAEQDPKQPTPQSNYHNLLDQIDGRRAAIHEATLAGDDQALDSIRQAMFDRGLKGWEVQGEFDAAERYGRQQALQAEQESAPGVESERPDRRHEFAGAAPEVTDVQAGREARLQAFLEQRSEEMAQEHELDHDVDL